MKRRSRAGGKPIKGRRRKALKTKRRDASNRRSRPVGFSGGDRLALLKIGQLRRKCRREGRPRLAARLVRDKIGMTFEQVLAVEAAQH